MLNSVVFPAPFGPISDTIDSSGMSSETSSTATRPPNSFDTFSARRMAGAVDGWVGARAWTVTLPALLPQPSQRQARAARFRLSPRSIQAFAFAPAGDPGGAGPSPAPGGTR